MSLNQLEPGPGRVFILSVLQAARRVYHSQPSLVGPVAGGPRAGASLPCLGWEHPSVSVAWCAVTIVEGKAGPVPVPLVREGKFTGITEACCVCAVVYQRQEKTGTVALLGAVSAHWCGAGMLAGSLAGWKSWKTAPGVLWRWGRGAQPRLWVAYPSAGLLPGWPLCLAPCSPGNASSPFKTEMQEEIHVYCQQIAMLGTLRESKAFGAYVCIVLGL